MSLGFKWVRVPYVGEVRLREEEKITWGWDAGRTRVVSVRLTLPSKDGYSPAVMTTTVLGVLLGNSKC